MKVWMLSWKKRGNVNWYAAYTETNNLVEFSLMEDASLAVIKRLRDGCGERAPVEVDVNDIKALHRCGGTPPAKQEGVLL